MSSENLEKQILATIVYYDILNYPLTAFEVFLYLVNEKKSSKYQQSQESRRKSGRKNGITLPDFRQDSNRQSPFTVCYLLDSSEYLKKYIDQKNGFYFLKKHDRWLHSPERLWSRSANANRLHSPKGTMELADEILLTPFDKGGINIVQQRLNRKKLADQKWKKARKIFRIMQVTPFLKMVLVSGSLAMGNSKNESDIDLIITAKKGRIWTVRTFVTLLTSVLRARRHNNVTKNKICLNHYITDKSLKIPFESLYNAQSYVHLVNVYNSEEDKKMFQKFQEENKWIKKYARNYKLSELGGFRSIGRNKIFGLVSGFFKIILSGKLGNYLEKELSIVQSKRIKKDPLYKKSGGRITISDGQLEFHPDSHEANVIPEFNKRMKKLELFEFGEQRDSGLI